MRHGSTSLIWSPVTTFRYPTSEPPNRKLA